MTKFIHTEEVAKILPDDLHPHGYIAVKCRVSDLAAAGVGTACGTVGNKALHALVKSFGDREILCWFSPSEMHINGMPLIRCTAREAALIERLAEKAEGSLRWDDAAKLERFQVFEIE